MYDEYIEDENNLRIVESLRKGCFTISQDEWEQFRRIIIWKAAKGFDPSKGAKFTSYLYTKARFEIMKYNNSFYKEKPKSIPELDFLRSLSYNPENGIVDILDSLNEEQKEIIILKYIYNHSMKEICEKLGINRKTYKKRIEESVDILQSIKDGV